MGERFLLSFRVRSEITRCLPRRGLKRRSYTLPAFCDAYGLAREQMRALPEIIEIRLETLCAFIEKCVERVIEEGHLALFEHDVDLLRRRRDELRKSLE